MDSVIKELPVHPLDIKIEKSLEIKIEEKEPEDEVQKMDCSDHLIKEEIDIGPEEFQQTVYNTNSCEAKTCNIPGSKCRLCNLTINFAAVQEEANGLETLCSIQFVGDGLFVPFDDDTLILHRDCLKSYTGPNWVKAEGSPFDFETKCVFCNQNASIAFKKSQEHKPHWQRATVATIKREATKIYITIKCIHRGDAWSAQVLQRIRNIDLETVIARYHQKCYALFFDPKVLGSRKRGRPSLDEIDEQMSYVYNYIENDEDSQHTLEEIRFNLKISVSDRTVKKKLHEKYGHEIIFTAARGGHSIINYVQGVKLQKTWHPVHPWTRKSGRPCLDEIEEQMSYVYNYIENDEDSQHTFEEISFNLKITLDDKTVKKKLQDKYGHDIIFTFGRDGQWILNFVPGVKLQKTWHPVHPWTRKSGRPCLDEIEEQMSYVYNYIENDEDSQHTFEEISFNLKITLDDKTVKKKLQDKYGHDIIFTFGRDGQWILNFVPGKNPQKTSNEPLRTKECIQKVHTIQSAANLIKNDIRTKVYEIYPSPNSFLTAFQSDIPESLELFLDSLIDTTDVKTNKSKKKAAIAHSIITAVRPCSYKSPLLLGLGTLLHHKYASRYLIDLLSGLGYSAAYNEVLLFELIKPHQTPYQTGFMQFAFDNVNQTLHDSKRVHVMKGIENIKPIDPPNQGVIGDRCESITRRNSI